MIETTSAGGVVLNSKGEVLVVSQNGTSWSLPKGHHETGEDDLAAATREIREETGVSDLKFIKRLGYYQRYKINDSGEEDRSEFKTIRMLLFRTTQDTLQPSDPIIQGANWVDKTEVAELLTHSKDKEFFNRIITDI